MILTNILLSILILVSICLCYQQQILKLDCKTKIIDNFDPNNDMYNDESMNVFKKVRFSLDCCPSTYSNDKGLLLLLYHINLMRVDQSFLGFRSEHLIETLSAAHQRVGSARWLAARTRNRGPKFAILGTAVYFGNAILCAIFGILVTDL